MRHALDRKRRVDVRIAIAAVIALVACSASVAAAATTSAPKIATLNNAAPLSLQVGVPSPSTNNTDFFYALESGIWTRLGVNITTVAQGTIEPTTIAAGRMVVGEFGTTGMFSGIGAGRDEVIVLNESTGDSGASITVKASSSYHTLMDLSGATVGVVGAGGQAFGAASAYSAYIVKNGGKPLNIVIEANVAANTAALSSGSIDAAIGTPVFGAAISAGIDRTLVSESSAIARIATGQGVAAGTFFGLRSLIKKNSTAIIRWIAGMRIALYQINHEPASAIAAVLAKNPTFAPTVLSASLLASEVDQERSFWAADSGFISKTTWNNSLKAFSNWGLTLAGLNVDLNSKLFSYANAVDMSYWTAATKLVAAYKKKWGLMSTP